MKFRKAREREIASLTNANYDPNESAERTNARSLVPESLIGAMITRRSFASWRRDERRALSARFFLHRRTRVSRPLFTHALRNLAYRGKSECTASAEIVMPRFTFHATEGTLPPNTAVLFTGGNGTG